MKNMNIWFCLGLVILVVLSIFYQWLSWLLLVVAFCCTAFNLINYTYSWIKNHNLKISRRERFLKMLASAMAFLLVVGSMLFMKIQSIISEDSATLMGSVIDALDLFMLDVDAVLLNKLPAQSLESYYLVCGIYLITVFSFVCTLAIFISLIYERLLALWNLRKLRKTKNLKPYLYIFWGMNDSSKLLAEKIKKKHGDESVILFVEEVHINEMDKGVWNSLIGFFSHERMTFDNVKDLNAKITIIDSRLSEISLSDETETKDIFGLLNMPTTKQAIENLPNKAQLHVFFFSDDEQKNIEDLNILSQDQTIDSFSKRGDTKVRFYCHSRYNNQTQILEDKCLSKNIQVKVIDSSKLSIEILKRNVQNHPISFVEINRDNNPGTVKSGFNSLIVGFGETGREAVRFLYEYSAFLDEKSDALHTKRSLFHCDIVDKNMDEIRPHFEAGISGVNKEDSPFHFHNCNYTSQIFYDEVMSEKELSKINYVIVSLGNDDEGMTVVNRILKQMIKLKGKSIEKFRIYLRVFDQKKANEYQKIADFYNETVDYIGKGPSNPLVVIFGKPKEIFDYDIIIDDTFEKGAIKYYTRYQEICAEKEQLLTTGSWENRQKMYLGKERMVISEIPSPDIWGAHKMNVDSGMYANGNDENVPVVNPNLASANLTVEFEEYNGKVQCKQLQKLHRQVSQDMSNALHALTKMYIYNKLKTSSTFDNNALMRNLAITEHLRWNAAHEMMGYVRGDKNSTSCDDLKKKHNCLVPWEELDEVSRRNGYSYYGFYPFSQRLKEQHPELEYYLSHDIYVYVPYHPIYKRYDEVVVKTTLQMWENGELGN